SRPWLEPLEDRTLLSANLPFDRVTGELVIRGDSGDNTVRQALTPDGFLEGTLDGRRLSSNPASALFDPALAGANFVNLTGIRFEGGGGEDTLTLGTQFVDHPLTVSAPGTAVVTENLAVTGPLSIRAQDITVSGSLHGGALTLAASGWVTVEPKGL